MKRGIERERKRGGLGGIVLKYVINIPQSNGELGIRWLEGQREGGNRGARRGKGEKEEGGGYKKNICMYKQTLKD